MPDEMTTTWYLATEYSDKIDTRQVRKETGQTLVIGKHRVAKHSQSEDYYPTLQQAEERLRKIVDGQVRTAEASLRWSQNKRDRVYSAYPPPPATDTEGAK